ncbi:MAG: hypothetical protein MR601_00510 [Erysipelotrichaceae bacterium]|nr:hypothetical protein [Erysipelotrichaceae bacterium]
MKINNINLLVVIILVITDFFLKKHIGKNEIFLELNKYKFKFILAGILLLLLIYSIMSRKYLLFIFWLIILKIIDKFIYIYKNKKI